MPEDAPKPTSQDVLNRAMEVIDAAEEQLKAPLTAATDPIPARPSAAAVARRRPAQAEPKVEAARPDLVTIVASGMQATTEEALEEVERAFAPSGLVNEGRQYLLSFPTSSWAKLGRDPGANAKILGEGMRKAQEARTNNVALTAALGCAPSQPIYDCFPSVSSPSAGVVDLPVTEGPRGSVTVVQGYNVFDLLAATGVGDTWTSGTKTCYEPTCGTAREFDASAVYTCLTLNNVVEFTTPEMLANLMSQSAIAHEHAVNAKILTAIQTEAIPYADPAPVGGGATVRLFSSLAMSATWYKQKYRAPLTTKFEAIIPAWALGVLQADQVARDSTTDPGVSLDGLTRQLAKIGINAQFVFDWQDGGLTSPGVPYYADVMLFPAGGVSRLQGATIDTGILRDAVLNSQNKFTWFHESYEGVVFCGIKPIRITSIDLCGSGATGERQNLVCGYS